MKNISFAILYLLALSLGSLSCRDEVPEPMFIEEEYSSIGDMLAGKYNGNVSGSDSLGQYQIYISYVDTNVVKVNAAHFTNSIVSLQGNLDNAVGQNDSLQRFGYTRSTKTLIVEKVGFFKFHFRGFKVK